MATRIYNCSELVSDLYNQIPSDGAFVLLIKNTTPGDKPFRLWQYDASSAATHDEGGGVIKPTLQTGNGRWLLRGYYSTQSDWNETDSASPAYIRNKPVTQSIVTPTIDTSAQIHATKNCMAVYPVSISVTSTLLGTNSGTVFLEISPDDSAWTTIAQIGNSVAGVVSTTIGTYVLTGLVPANYYRRLRTVQAGTNGATITSLQGQEILI